MHLDKTTKNAIAIRQGKELKTLAHDLNALTAELHNGDTSHIQSILFAQSITLGSIFENLLQQAINTPSTQIRMGLLHTALKAQEQSRKTLGVITAMHQPKAATLIQNNHAENQQINIS